MLAGFLFAHSRTRFAWPASKHTLRPARVLGVAYGTTAAVVLRRAAASVLARRRAVQRLGHVARPGQRSRRAAARERGLCRGRRADADDRSLSAAWAWHPRRWCWPAASIYLFIRFGVGRLLRYVTVHRGMFHSIPALAIVGELAYLICSHENRMDATVQCRRGDARVSPRTWCSTKSGASTSATSG